MTRKATGRGRGAGLAAPAAAGKGWSRQLEKRAVAETSGDLLLLKNIVRETTSYIQILLAANGVYRVQGQW